jgi:hypothetical protein
MEYTIMAVDLILKFRLAAFPHKSPRPQTWQMDVMTIEDVAEVLASLGLLDSDAARKLAEASTTVVPQPGLNTVPLTFMADLVEFVSPLKEPPSAEAQDGYMLVVQGETTEEDLAQIGFVVNMRGPLQ